MGTDTVREAIERGEFAMPLARELWAGRYRALRPDGAPEHGISDSWRRVAAALAAAEGPDAADWRIRFLDVLRDFRFLPGGRILAGAGTGDDVTLANCFAMGSASDAPGALERTLEQALVTMRAGGGIGCDFSTLAPAGSALPVTGVAAPGPLAAMQRFDTACARLLTHSPARRGAMMATLRCDHPDIADFISVKREPGKLVNFNLSVLVSDAFMQARAAGAEWPLVYPAGGPARDFQRQPARALWQRLIDAAYDSAEPGILFVDRINRDNNLAYCERIHTTNPCGEIPLPDHGACVLGSLNLARYVRAPFTAEATLDEDLLAAHVGVAVRMLDDAIEVSAFPLAAQRVEARRCRRIGLGVTGLADALLMLGRDYGAEDSAPWAGRMMARLRDAAYRASCALAREKGPFPAYARDAFLASAFVRQLPPDLRDAIARHGLRNSHLLAIAPAGTISLLAGNVSSGIEPIFQASHRRHVRRADGSEAVYEIEDHACRRWRELGRPGLPPGYRAASELPPEAHIAMQAAVQAAVDNAVAKTVNVPADIDRGAFAALFEQAYAAGLKGLTVYRPVAVRGAILEPPCAVI